MEQRERYEVTLHKMVKDKRMIVSLHEVGEKRFEKSDRVQKIMQDLLSDIAT